MSLLSDIFSNQNVRDHFLDKFVDALKIIRQYAKIGTEDIFLEVKGPLRTVHACDNMVESHISKPRNLVALLNVYIKQFEEYRSTQFVTQGMSTFFILCMWYLFPKSIIEIKTHTQINHARLYFDIVPISQRMELYMGGVKEQVEEDGGHTKQKRVANSRYECLIDAMTAPQMEINERIFLGIIIDCAENDIDELCRSIRNTRYVY